LLAVVRIAAAQANVREVAVMATLAISESSTAMKPQDPMAASAFSSTCATGGEVRTGRQPSASPLAMPITNVNPAIASCPFPGKARWPAWLACPAKRHYEQSKRRLQSKKLAFAISAPYNGNEIMG